VRKVARRATTPAEPEPEAVTPLSPPSIPKMGPAAKAQTEKDPFLGKRHERIVVGIDASLTGTAICLYDPDTGQHGAYRLKPKSKGVRRLIEIGIFVYQRLHLARFVCNEISHICMEDYAMGAKGKTFHMGEGGGAVKTAIIQALGSNHKVAYPTLVSPTALKKFVLGKSQGEKSDMKMATLKRWGAEFSDDNECDAFGLAQVAALLVREDLAKEATQAQQEVLAKVNLHAEWEE
jgi:Holliday junction resolvasome RuvABC endonuclease subunit